MIKAKTTGPDGAPGYLFGLTEENVRRLKDGKPILIQLSEMGGTGTVFIMYGKNEKDLHDILKPYIGADTKITIDPKLLKEHGYDVKDAYASGKFVGYTVKGVMQKNVIRGWYKTEAEAWKACQDDYEERSLRGWSPLAGG